MTNLSPLAPLALKRHVADLLANDPTVPEGHRGALVTVVNQDRVELALATKVTDHWTVSLVGSYDWKTGTPTAGLTSKITW